MHELLTLPGTESVQPFCYYSPAKKPTRCDILLQRAGNWAIATDRVDNQGIGVVQCATTLAGALCTQFELDPQQLILLTYYTHIGGESFYSLHFKHWARDFFAGVQFMEAHRESIQPLDVPLVMQMLTAGNHEPSQLRAILDPAYRKLLS